MLLDLFLFQEPSSCHRRSAECGAEQWADSEEAGAPVEPASDSLGTELESMRSSEQWPDVAIFLPRN